MNLLVVDDQRLSRAGLIKMIEWERLGLKLVGECSDGRQALEQIGDKEADIIITDVRMPVMDGLELIEKAKEQYEGLAFIVISGYDDYDYVRRSIHLTVDDYLLKPVDPQELNALLAKVARRHLERKRRTEAELTKWREQFFYFVLEGAYMQDETQLLAEFADLRFADAHDRFTAAVFESEWDKPSVCELLRPLVDRYGICVLRTRGVYLLIAAGAEATAERLAEDLAQVRRQDGHELRLTGIGSTVQGIVRLRDSIEQAFDAFAIKTSLPEPERDEPLTYEQLQASSPLLVPFDSAAEQEWTFHLRQGNREAALRKLDELLSVPAFAHPDIVDGSYHYALLRGTRELYEAGRLHETDFVEACRVAKSLPNLIGQETKRRAVHDFFGARLMADSETQAVETRQAVEKAKAYIDAHYCETIVLSELAQSSYMSPGYFSALFRQHTGKNFLEYVSHLRIERAKALIAADPEQKISDVALKCGYQDLKYFRKLFKRHTGMTPLSFKEDAAGAR
ncbi:response regulator [Paenibacillus tyrfis]|uniref:response regulator n=1 Tax=Paenibacillus tyrfis TaxID=1501230 RepID=UPI000B595DEF|nr:response regulator [Paenibacillus tyrfis]